MELQNQVKVDRRRLKEWESGKVAVKEVPEKDPETCIHEKALRYPYGTIHCFDCGASRGMGNLWRT